MITENAKDIQYHQVRVRWVIVMGIESPPPFSVFCL